MAPHAEEHDLGVGEVSAKTPHKGIEPPLALEHYVAAEGGSHGRRPDLKESRVVFALAGDAMMQRRGRAPRGSRTASASLSCGTSTNQ